MTLLRAIPSMVEMTLSTFTSLESAVNTEILSYSLTILETLSPKCTWHLPLCSIFAFNASNTLENPCEWETKNPLFASLISLNFPSTAIWTFSFSSKGVDRSIAGILMFKTSLDKINWEECVSALPRKETWCDGSKLYFRKRLASANSSSSVKSLEKRSLIDGSF